MVSHIALYCGITFGQAALFPSSMAVAATFAVLLHENIVWASAATGLWLVAFLLVRVTARE